jgi:hypothetical protein
LANPRPPNRAPTTPTVSEKAFAERGHAELIVDLGTDDRELGECRIHQLTLKLWVFPQRHTEDRGQREQKRKG